MRHKFDRWQVLLTGVIMLMLGIMLGMSLGGVVYAWSPPAGENVVLDNARSVRGKNTGGTEQNLLTLYSNTCLNTPAGKAILFTVDNAEKARLTYTGSMVLPNGVSYSAKNAGGTVQNLLTLWNNTCLNAPSGKDILFTVNNGEKARLTSTGYVGIGDTTPVEGKLVVRATSGHAVYGVSLSNTALYGTSTGGLGVYGESTDSAGGRFRSENSNGVHVQYAGFHGVSVSYAEQYGGYFEGGAGGVKAVSADGDLIVAVDSGSSNTRFKVDNAGNVTADGTYTSPASDFAEMLLASSEMGPGDVLVIGADGKLALSDGPESTTVAGVYSTKPGFVGGAGDDEDLTGKVPLAMVGVVPVKASAGNGSINPGDLLCTSAIPGHAMKAVQPKVGAIIGKALQGLPSGTGTIRVLVTLQ